MKESGILLKSMLLLNLLIFLLTIADFLALHDIHNDYISAEMLDLHQITTSVALPAWTATQGEWQTVSISFWARAVFLVANFLLLSHLNRKTRQ